MKYMRIIVVLTLLSSLVGCAGHMGGRSAWVFQPPEKAVSYVDALWLNSGKILNFRQESLFEMGRRKLSMTGFMRLDTSKAVARVVAMNEMGIKIFDVTVTPSGHIKHHLAADLERVPAFVKHVARVIRRVFLEGVPKEGDTVETRPDVVRIVSHADRELDFLFHEQEKTLFKKENTAKEWVVSYVGYHQEQSQAGLAVPEKIIYNDKDAGYSLSMLLDYVQ